MESQPQNTELLEKNRKPFTHTLKGLAFYILEYLRMMTVFPILRTNMVKITFKIMLVFAS